MVARAISRGEALGVTCSRYRRRRSAAYTVSATRARSWLPRFLLSRKNCPSWRSAGALAGSTAARAWTIASSCARARFMGIGLAPGDARRDLLDHEAIARDGVAKLHRQVVLVHPEPDVDHRLVLGIDVAQVQGAHLAHGNVHLFLAEDLQIELIELAL